jgi:hypothetical protein
MPRSYATANLKVGTGSADVVRDLQRDLRALGYLHEGIDGAFREATELAVRRLQYDLLNNSGASTADDGAAPVAINSYNNGRVTGQTGEVDPGLAACIDDMLADPKFPKLPSAADPVVANRTARAAIAAAIGTPAPAPFLLAIFQQERGGKHFAEPTAYDADSFVLIGLDAQPATPDQITSRGYGIGQYTLFHHPPRPDEVQDFIADPVRNVQQAFAELRDKFDHNVIGATQAAGADDRAADHPLLTALRACRYQASDARYMGDCKTCAGQANKRDLAPTTPVYANASLTYGQAPQYAQTTYRSVPDRADFLCDWPYAVRQYNGGGADSYHYQARILMNLLNPK